MGKIIDTEPAVPFKRSLLAAAMKRGEKAHKIPPLKAQSQNICLQSWKSLGGSGCSTAAAELTMNIANKC